jgi:hypothetical protein
VSAEPLFGDLGLFAWLRLAISEDFSFFWKNWTIDWLPTFVSFPVMAKKPAYLRYIQPSSLLRPV